MPLTQPQTRQLRSLAHHLKPVVRLGQDGLKDSVLAEINTALDHHELIKVKLSAGDRQARDATLRRICEETAAHCVQRVGHIAVLYRRNPEKPVIPLPGQG